LSLLRNNGRSKEKRIIHDTALRRWNPDNLPGDFAAGRRGKKRGGRRLEIAAYQVEGAIHMADVIFPKRTPTPRELDTRPIPSDYRPKRVRLLDGSSTQSEGYYGDELTNQNYSEASMEISGGVNLPRPDEFGGDRLNEIATLVRTLTYGEMMELAHAIWKIRPEGAEVDQYSLPMMLHLWSTSSEQ